jgi:glyoxylase-like metal-dependent hydrolase (beta-lactamase superfamily II)/ACT domain-containing protein
MDTVRVYSPVGSRAGMVKMRAFLEDKPGSLASFASLIASSGGNITVFHYDRSQDSRRVVAEADFGTVEEAAALAGAVAEKGLTVEPEMPVKDVVAVTRPDSVLELKVRLTHEPGTLAALAELLMGHGANVIYMLYNEDFDAESSDIAIALGSPEEADGLLVALNGSGYHYRVVYRGSDTEAVERIIGLKAVEKFFLRLSRLIGADDLEEVRSLVESSQDLHMDLVGFYSEAGDNLDSADVFEKVLALGSMARGRTGECFTVREMEAVELPGGVRLLGFRMPTSEDVYIFEKSGEMALVDSGYGVYYEDIKRLMRDRGLDPARVRRVLVTHADADHAGTSGMFEREFGSEVFLHRDSVGVLESGNRAFGSTGRLLRLNGFYTRLVNRFTEFCPPERPRFYAGGCDGEFGGFRVLEHIDIFGLDIEVLLGLGGHIIGQVFFLERQAGLLFASDYLFNMRSLTVEEKDSLGVYKYLLINPNRDAALFREESELLKAAVVGLGSALSQEGGRMLVLPGHGDWFPASRLG